MKYSCLYHASLFQTQLIVSCHFHYFVTHRILISRAQQTHLSAQCDKLKMKADKLKKMCYIAMYSDEDEPVFQGIIPPSPSGLMSNILLISLFYFSTDSKH